MTTRHSVMAADGQFDIKQGTFASYKGKAVKIRRILSVESVLVQFTDSGETERVYPPDLRPVSEAEVEPVQADVTTDDATTPATKRRRPGSVSLPSIEEEDWEEASRRYEIIKPLISNPNRNRKDVEAAARSHAVATSTVYRWMNSYLATGHMSGLINGVRGRKAGDNRLAVEIEAVIDELLEEYLDPQAITQAAFIKLVEEKCEDLGLLPPHPNTLRNRIRDIPLKRRMSTRGQTELARREFEPTPDKFPHGTFPLQTIQIDHVKLDIKVVDAITGKPIETRPWLTLAIDSYSRMITGYFLSLNSPSAFGTGVCLYMSIMPKRNLLDVLKLPGKWPVYGMMRNVFFDNAKEFKGETLQRACDEQRINLILRPVKTPRYGAYIESMVGNVNKQLHKRRGTTHRSPKVSPDYDSSAQAIYTLAILEAEIVDWIVNSYHVDLHSSLNTTPLNKWELGLMGEKGTYGAGLPLPVANPEKMRLDFLPHETRAVHPYGIEIGCLTYYNETLNRWINARDPDDPTKKRQFICHYDPRTIRRIWFWDPDLKQYFVVPLRDLTWPDISWSEFDEYRKAMKKEGVTHIDEAAIKGFVQRSRLRETQASEQTAALQKANPKPPKGSSKKPHNSAPGSNLAAQTPPGTSPMAAPVESDSIESVFSTPANSLSSTEL